MPRYRLFFVEQSRIDGQQEFTATSDQEAIGISAVVAGACADIGQDFLLWSETRPLRRLGIDGRIASEIPAAAELALETQGRILDLEEALHQSRARIGRSRLLLQKTAALRREFGAHKRQLSQPEKIATRPRIGRHTSAHRQRQGEDRTRRPDAIDIEVGRQIRMARQLAGLSLEEVAKGIGVSVQAMHRFEAGTVRIAASRLFALAKFLERPVDGFFVARDKNGGAGELDTLSPQEIAVIRGLRRTRSPGARAAIVELVKQMGMSATRMHE